MMNYVIYNGKLYPENQVPIGFNNRAFKYGDSVFETIRCNGHCSLHYSLHYSRLRKALLSLKMDIASFPREEELNENIVKLLQKNKSFGASRVRIQVFRSGEGLYTPESNQVDFLIEFKSLPTNYYHLNEKGLLVDVYPDMQKGFSPISSFKNGNSLHYILAGIYKQENGLNDCLLLNSGNKVVEATSSNLFWIKDGKIYTPSVFSGCVDGVMRRILITVIKENKGISVIETQGVSEEVLMSADEVFLTNAIQGIQWVVGFKEKRYFNRQVKQLVQEINNYTFNEKKAN
jgi:branched-chain amino acid aminotransferase